MFWGGCGDCRVQPTQPSQTRYQADPAASPPAGRLAAQDMEVCVHGSSMASAAFQRALFAALRALIDELGCATFNACVYNIQLGDDGGAANGRLSQPYGGVGGGGGGQALPVVARVVGRGKLSSLASDFGGLEVFGGASIGHTDPFRVAEALRSMQASLGPH